MVNSTTISSKSELSSLSSNLNSKCQELNSIVSNLKSTMGNITDPDGLGLTSAASTISKSIEELIKDFTTISTNINNYSNAVNELDGDDFQGTTKTNSEGDASTTVATSNQNTTTTTTSETTSSSTSNSSSYSSQSGLSSNTKRSSSGSSSVTYNQASNTSAATTTSTSNKTPSVISVVDTTKSGDDDMSMVLQSAANVSIAGVTALAALYSGEGISLKDLIGELPNVGNSVTGGAVSLDMTSGIYEYGNEMKYIDGGGEKATTPNTEAKTETQENKSEYVIDTSIYKENLDNGFQLTTGNTTYDLDEDDFDLLCSIVAAESDKTRDDALAVASVILNRCESKWKKYYGSNPISQATAKNQFVVYQKGYYKRYLNGNYSEKVKTAVNDALHGLRNNSYLSFRSSGTKSYSNNRISRTGNRYK